MARVPHITDPSVGETPLPDVTGSIAPSNLGAAFSQFGDKVRDAGMRLYKKEQDDANQIAVMSADRKLSEYVVDYLHNPETGALSKTGTDSLELPETALVDFDTFSGGISQQARNDTQKLAIQQLVDRHRGDVDLSINRHVSTQIQKVDDAETESYLENSRSIATINYTVPARVEEEIQSQQVAVRQYAVRNGFGVEETKIREGEVVSTTVRSVIERALSAGEDRTASAYKESIGEYLRGDDLIAVEKALEEGTIRGESQRRVDEIVASSENRKEALTEARKIDDPKLRDATVDRVNAHYSHEEQAENEIRSDAFDKSTLVVEETGSASDVPFDVWTVLTPSQKNTLETRARQVASGKEPLQNDRAWLEFRDIEIVELGNLSSADFYLKYRTRFDDTHWGGAVELWSAARDYVKGGRKTKAAVISSTLTFRQRVNNSMRAHGIIDPDKRVSDFSEDEARMFQQFETRASAVVEHFELTALAGKRRATGTEIQSLLDQLFLDEVYVSKLFFDKKKPAILLSDKEIEDTYVPLAQIPADSLGVLRNLARSKGFRITERKLERAYAAALIGDDKLVMDILEGVR